MEKDVERIEEGIRTYEKQKVFVLKGEDGSPILEGIDDNNNGAADRKESGFSVASGWDGGIFGDRKASKGPAFFDRKASGASVTADRKSTTGSVVFAQDIEFA